ncbi:MAG: HAMP domain-containing sensor histidine kinase [Rhodothermales bacterium]|nr:HAMP domain-containing sensor histidine kinase [Rhodothermales bacterium]
MAAVLMLLGVLVWVAVYVGLEQSALDVVQAEIDEVASHILEGDALNLDGYIWTEPHHLFAEPRINPHFLQVFDSDGVLLRESVNVELLGSSMYPDSVISSRSSLIIRSFRAGDHVLYSLSQPVLTAAGDTAAFVQVARFDPGLRRTMRNLATVLIIGLVSVLGGLLWLVSALTNRVLRPLTQMTGEAERISPERMGQRIELPDRADRETTVLAETINSALDELEHAFENMRRFTSDAAHELQTPLTVIRGEVDVALRLPRSTDEYIVTLAHLRSEVEGLIRAVRSMLLLARMDQQTGRPATAQIDFSRIVMAEIEAHAVSAEERGLLLTADVEEGARCCGQSELLREVVVNVLDNALKFTRVGSVHARVRQDPDCVNFEVSDSGVGIVAEDLERVTERFFRSQQVDGSFVPGSGLGLPIVHQIVEWHGGSLEIDSERGRGTTVRVKLPSACERVVAGLPAA